MVMISKATGEQAFYLNEWDMRQFQRGLGVTYFADPRDQEHAVHVQEVAKWHLSRLDRTRHIYSAIPPVEPRFEAEYAPVVMAALRYNLYAQLPPQSGPEVPNGYKYFARKTNAAVRKLSHLATMANQAAPKAETV